MKMVSLFSGIGGFDLAAIRNNIEIVGVYEYDKYCIQVYNKQFGTDYKPTDITKVDTKDIPDHDILCAGFPCQKFSIAGKREGFKAPEGNLFFEIARVLKHKKPKMVLLENVKGLLSHDRGRTFKIIINTLRELGYVGQYQVLNSKDFGVAQNRERVFIFCTRGKCRRQVFPIKQDDKKIVKLQGQQTNTLTARYEKAQATGSYIIESKLDAQIKQIDATKGAAQGARVYSTDGLSTTINSGGGGLGGKTGLYMVPKLNKIGTLNITTQKRSFDTPKEINQYLKDHKGSLTITQIATKLELPNTQVEHYFRIDSSRAIPSPDIWTKLKQVLGFGNKFDKVVTETYTKQIEYESSLRVYSPNGISPTITSVQPIIHCTQTRSPNRPSLLKNPKSGGSGHIFKTDGITYCLDTNNSQAIEQGYRIRRLTPVECERLQGFPSDWTKYGIDDISDTQRYKMCGNAVTVPVIEAIFKMIL